MRVSEVHFEAAGKKSTTKTSTMKNKYLLKRFPTVERRRARPPPTFLQIRRILLPKSR